MGKSVLEPRHVRCVGQFTRLLGPVVPADCFLLVQSPIRLTDDSEPEPDVSITREWNFPHTNPTAADVPLIVEVAKSSIREDRAEKLPRYARAGETLASTAVPALAIAVADILRR